MVFALGIELKTFGFDHCDHTKFIFLFGSFLLTIFHQNRFLKNFFINLELLPLPTYTVYFLISGVLNLILIL